MNKRLSKQSWDWWFEMPPRSLWRHCNAAISCIYMLVTINLSFRIITQLDCIYVDYKYRSMSTCSHAKADMFMSYMYCLVVRNIPLHIDYWWQNLSPLRLSGKLRGRRSYDVFFGIQNSRMSERRRYCHFGGVLRWFHWMMSLDNLQCVRWRESRRDDDIFVSVNNHWGFFFMKSHICWYLKFYPFLWSYCDKIVFSYFMCTLSQTLLLSTSLLLGSFRYMFNIIIVLTCIVSICRF